MPLRFIGEHPLAKDARGRLISRIATLFPIRGVMVTASPPMHAMQRWKYLDWLNLERAAAGKPLMSHEEETAEWSTAVDLIIDGDVVLIRPDPDNMPLAFLGDDVMQADLPLADDPSRRQPKHKIKYLNALNWKVRDAIKRRGECWRITPLPTSDEEMKQLIRTSRAEVSGREIYYYNRTTGTRFLTCGEFCRLRGASDAELAQHLAEIKDLATRINPLGHSEIAFFAAGDEFTQADFDSHDFANPGPWLREVYGELCRRFRLAAPAAFRQDDLENHEWRNRMFASLIGQGEEYVSEETLLGLSSEFFMQIRWLPGGRIENGELILDPLFEMSLPGGEAERGRLCDLKARHIIYNFVREYGDIEYLNIGRVENSLSRRPEAPGRRQVYIAELKLRSNPNELVRVIRVAKWGIREHLNRGKFHLQSILESEEYTEYCLDRRLGCRQLGMALPRRVVARKLWEKYTADWTGPGGIYIWATYFERDYIRGIATDKMPRHRFQDPAFALAFARLLGEAAAPNIIVGRCDHRGNVLFDDGDEVILEDDDNRPVSLVVADQTGTFSDYARPLYAAACQYAEPVNRRVEFLPEPEEFARVYFEAFLTRFGEIQREYRRSRGAFDALFHHRPWDPGGSFAYRWEQILRRLDTADPRDLVDRMLEACVVKLPFLASAGCP